MNPTAGASNPGPRIDPDNPPYRELRELLQAAFEPDTLRRFCQDDPLFRPLRDRFAHNASLLDMIDKVLDLSRTQLLWEDLLDGVAEHSPRQYNRFAARMGWAQVSELESKDREDEGKRVDTGGGAYIGGGVTVSEGGDFVGRDQIIIYGTPPDLEAITGEPRTPETVAQQEALRLDAALPDQEPTPAEEAALSPPSDVEIHVGAGADGSYPVAIQTPQASDASSTLDLIPPAEQLRGWLADLEGEGVDRARQAEIGGALFRALFPEAIRDRYMAALDEAMGGVRLHLWLDTPELQALPWELLYDALDDEFLALSGRTLVTRYLSVPRGAPPLAVRPPLRVLVATASPQGHPALDLEAEVAAVREALAPARAQVESLPHARVMALREALRDFRPHVLHFAGHGAAGPDGGALLLEDEAGDADLLPARQLRIMIQRSGADVRLAVLNACLTARGEPDKAAALDAQRRALLGVGPALVRAGLGAVVAMQFSLNDASARLFARDFYDTVARLEPVDLAVSRAREALALGAGTDSRDWATPALFLRARDGVIFAPATLGGL